ncbi:MAG: fused MFS/spermidine synthase [Caulobacter sp.]|nr:fused MFS/spermidine synthase [Caulobacter sp.]
MTDAVPIPAETTDPVARETLPWIYILAVFCGASMVFMVQPMVAKLVLPQLGGSPQVWNTSMAFFQGALLVGYGYAHFLQKIPRARTQIMIHLGVMLLAATLLPLRITTLLGEPGATPPALWLLGVLTISIGAPFAALSATAPLVQAWHAKVHGREGGPEPWALYAASNLGSLLALLAYPVIMEPALLLHDQRWGWSGLYVAFIGVMIVLALNIRRHDTAPSAAIQAARPEAVPVTWRQRLTWIALAALPSSLMLGVTAHLTTDVASAPFLWVLPLSLYLLTFIIAFQTRPMIPPRLGLILMSTALIVTVATMPFGSPNVLFTLGIHLGTFFLCALVCHQALVANRPDPGRLTDFYLCMSIGGVVGGAFNAFVAPLIFETVTEYILVLCLCALVRPFGQLMPTRRELIVCVVAVLGFVLAMISVTDWFWYAFVDPRHAISSLTLVRILAGLGLAVVVALGAMAFARRSAGEPPRRMEWIFLGLAAVVWGLTLAAAFATGGALRPIQGMALIDLVLILVAVSGLALGAAIVLFKLRPDLAVAPTRLEWLALALAAIGFDLAFLTLASQFTATAIPAMLIVRVAGAVGVVTVAVCAVMVRERALLFFAAICLLAYSAYMIDPHTDYYQSRRSFFGVVHFSYADIEGYGKSAKELGMPGNVRVFSHGTTLHGAQALDPAYRCRPLVYYAPETPIGQVFNRVQGAKPAVTIGAVGLGTGAVAAYVRPADRMTFFEIDPHVVATSSDPKVFSYTTQCAKGLVDYVLGDARLTLEKQPAGKYDILLIDAFSSDAIPAHLLTVEAVRGYLARVKPDGIVILHLSNRHLELIFPAASVVHAAGGHALFQGHTAAEGKPNYWESSEDVMIVAKDPAVLASYSAEPQWLPPPPASVRPWTDDYTNLIGAMVGSLQKRRWTWQNEAEVRRASPPAPPPAPPAPPAGR